MQPVFSNVLSERKQLFLAAYVSLILIFYIVSLLYRIFMNNCIIRMIFLNIGMTSQTSRYPDLAVTWST